MLLVDSVTTAVLVNKELPAAPSLAERDKTKRCRRLVGIRGVQQPLSRHRVAFCPFAQRVMVFDQVHWRPKRNSSSQHLRESVARP
ncbi:MAG: hypothetical protein EBR63_00015 [Actinobacteria bacterium]|nr:hypothetical protein [Actinomycetota bacterium]